MIGEGRVVAPCLSKTRGEDMMLEVNVVVFCARFEKIVSFVTVDCTFLQSLGSSSTILMVWLGSGFSLELL